MAVLSWSTTQVGGAMILRTSGEANRSGWGVCERAFKLGEVLAPRLYPDSSPPYFSSTCSPGQFEIRGW